MQKNITKKALGQWMFLTAVVLLLLGYLKYDSNAVLLFLSGLSFGLSIVFNLYSLYLYRKQRLNN